MTTDADPDDSFPVTELAKQVRVHRTTLYRAIRAGQLLATRVGVGRGTLRVTGKDWADYLAACRANAAAP